MQTTSGIRGVGGMGAGAAVGGGGGGVVGGGVVSAGVVVVGWVVVEVGGGSVVATAVGTVDAATVVGTDVDSTVSMDRAVVAVGLVLQAASRPADNATTHKRDRSMLPEPRMVVLRS
jgi:hypothetical protein